MLDSHVKQAEGVEDKSAEVTEIRNELLKAEEVTVEAAQIDIAILQEGMSPSRGQSHFARGPGGVSAIIFIYQFETASLQVKLCHRT